MRIKERTINQQVYTTCIEHGYPEIVARIIAGRTNTFNKNIFEFSLDAIKPANTITDCSKAAQRIVKAIHNNEIILLFTDYDVDGCTSMALLYRALHDVFGVLDSNIIRLTGDRTFDGYGLTDPIADKIMAFVPNLVITADAGASDGARIEKIADTGIDVIVTDHHLIPKEGVPKSAFAFINPQRENCEYDSLIAGCGVAWLLMTAVSQEIGATKEQKQKIHQLLDYVALGTVADLVSLTSVTNRYFIQKGLEFMNRKLRPCWQVALSGTETDATTVYLGFQLGPRINASSRITGKAVTALEFLMSDDSDAIANAYKQLDTFNSARQEIEKEMFDEAKASMDVTAPALHPVLIYYSKNNHPGIQGIVAGKITENFGIPVIMIADIGNGVLTGSGRAGQFLHIRNALQTFDDRFPGIFIAYGGHKAAAGFKLHKDNFDLFKKEMTNIVIEQLAGQDTTPYLQTDGSLKKRISLNDKSSLKESSSKELINLGTYYQIEALKPFGIGFPAPLFHDQMVATNIKVIGKNPIHLSMMLDEIKAVFFNAIDKPGDPLPIHSGDFVDVVYTLSLNSWQGRENLQLIIKKIYRLGS